MSATPLHRSEVIVSDEGPGWNREMGRLRVAGGWLYVLQVHSIRGVAASMQFVPDQEPAPDLAAELAGGAR